MADKTIQLKLKLTPSSETKKALTGLKDVSKQWDRVFGPNGDKPVRNQARQLTTLRRSWQDLSASIKLAGDNFKEGFKSRFTEKQLESMGKTVDKLSDKWKKLKFAAGLAVTAGIAGGAYFLGKSLITEGGEQIRTRKRLKREFGDEAPDIQGAASRINFRAGIQDDEAARGLIPLAEQLQAIQGGAQFRGMKKPLTESQATALRKKNLNFGADIYRRVATMVPDIEPEDLGRILGDALAGPEGIRTMVSQLQLSKRSKTLSQLNEKGQAYKALRPEEQKRLGITKAGQYLEQGDLVNLLLERSGITDKAAQDEQKTFGHQIKQIKSTLMDQIGDIGSDALDSLTEKLGKGATAAERLQSYLKSDEGKKTIESIKDTVIKIVEGIASIVQDVPKIGKFLSDHKVLLETLAIAYAGTKAAGVAISVGKGIGAVVEGAGAATGALKAGAKALPGIAAAGLPALAVVGAGAAGLGVGAAAGYGLNKLTNKIEDKYKVDLNPFGQYSKKDFQAADAELQRLKAIRDQKRAERAQQPPQELHAHLTVQLDGHTVSKVVEKHLVRAADNRTARGASPVSKE